MATPRAMTAQAVRSALLPGFGSGGVQIDGSPEWSTQWAATVMSDNQRRVRPGSDNAGLPGPFGGHHSEVSPRGVRSAVERSGETSQRLSVEAEASRALRGPSSQVSPRSNPGGVGPHHLGSSPRGVGPDLAGCIWQCQPRLRPWAPSGAPSRWFPHRARSGMPCLVHACIGAAGLASAPERLRALPCDVSPERSEERPDMHRRCMASPAVTPGALGPLRSVFSPQGVGLGSPRVGFPWCVMTGPHGAPLRILSSPEWSPPCSGPARRGDASSVMLGAGIGALRPHHSEGSPQGAGPGPDRRVTVQTVASEHGSANGAPSLRGWRPWDGSPRGVGSDMGRRGVPVLGSSPLVMAAAPSPQGGGA